MARQVKHCVHCQVVCTDDNMTITVTVVGGPTRLTYKPVAICSEQCLRSWASDTIWHADDDPRVTPFLVAPEA